MAIDRDNNNSSRIFISSSNNALHETSPRQITEKEAYLVINEVAEEAGIIHHAYIDDRSYFSDSESKPKVPKFVKIKGYLFPPSEVHNSNLKDHIEKPILREPKIRTVRSNSFSTDFSPSDYIEIVAKKQNSNIENEEERSSCINLAIQENQNPVECLLSELLEASARKQIKNDVKRKKTVQKQIDIFSKGLLWKAKNKDTIRKNSDETQLFRGQRQFQKITINEIEYSYSLTNENKIDDYDETKPYKPEEIPPAIFQFYNNLFNTLAAYGFDFGVFDREKSLHRLFSHKKKNVSPSMLKFLQSTNMGMWGYCHMELTRTLPLFFTTPYKTAWNRNGLNDVSNTISCDIVVEKKKIWVTQKKNYALFIKATGMEEKDTPLLTFTVSWKVRLPKSGKKFKALLLVSDSQWCAEVSNEHKIHFLSQFNQQLS